MAWDFVARCATSCIEVRLRSLLRTYERSTCSKSSSLFTETKSANEKKNDANIQLWPNKVGQKRVYVFYGQVTVILIHNGLSCCYLVSYE